MRRRDPLARALARPLAAEWGDDEPMTLVEAIAVLFPAGPLTVASLRREIKKGNLAAKRVAGKDWTTPRSIREMMQPCRGKPRARASSSASGKAEQPSTSSSTPAAQRSAQAAALMVVQEQRKRLQTISPASTPRR